ncbi:MAG: hypothetical protein MAG451_01596 [Anaerolineales bacterium]|nr:hypothetical protein [Anaerolineales bacterium]
MGIPEFKTSQKPKGFWGKQAMLERFISLEVPMPLKRDPELRNQSIRLTCEPFILLFQ